MKEWLYGFYGVHINLPLSGAARRWRRFSHSFRGKSRRLQPVRLPPVSWRQCTARRWTGLREPDKANGNVRISELAIINLIAADCEPGSALFEIGTFDGRTTLNMAFASPQGCSVYTLDLPADATALNALDEGERHMVDKPVSGARIAPYRASHEAVTGKIHQLQGDSARFDFSPYHKRCGLVFVDGSHTRENVLSDTENALKMVKDDGVILWHDYGIWEGVTQALEETESRRELGLRYIRGTSLAYWRNSAAD